MSTTDDRSLWEVLVPCAKNDGTPFRTRHHREWDRQVRAVTGGLTILKPARGQWVAPNGELFIERVIPVRVVATRSQIERVVEITLRHYDQLAVLAYKISDEVIYRIRA